MTETRRPRPGMRCEQLGAPRCHETAAAVIGGYALCVAHALDAWLAQLAAAAWCEAEEARP